MKDYENEFIKYINKVSYNNYMNMQDIYDNEDMNDIEMYLNDFCEEKEYNFLKFQKNCKIKKYKNKM